MKCQLMMYYGYGGIFLHWFFNEIINRQNIQVLATLKFDKQKYSAKIAHAHNPTLEQLEY